MPRPLPVLFITHGSPLLAIEPGETGPMLTTLGHDLAKLAINTILVISAHWITKAKTAITASDLPDTIHDFSGFPQPLYQAHYPAKGSLQMAQLVQSSLKQKGIDAELDHHRGLDHGAWIPLQYLFPDANIPVLEISIPWPMSNSEALQFGQALKPLREQGVLIIGSGSMTHNLYDVGDNTEEQASYIAPFVEWVRKTIHRHDLASITNYRQLAPYAKSAHPTDEHFLPLIITLGASDEKDLITELNAGVTYQALAMDNYIFGHLLPEHINKLLL